jgi:hypothetical protein
LRCGAAAGLQQRHGALDEERRVDEMMQDGRADAEIGCPGADVVAMRIHCYHRALIGDAARVEQPAQDREHVWAEIGCDDMRTRAKVEHRQGAVAESTTEFNHKFRIGNADFPARLARHAKQRAFSKLPHRVTGQH